MGPILTLSGEASSLLKEFKSERFNGMDIKFDFSLKEGYTKTQLSWHKKQKQNILPPNCSNKSYYADIGVCKPDNFCKFIKNPTQYSIKKYNLDTKSRKS